MKLLTINVHSWLEENQLEKLNILAKTIVEKKYDVVAMQEVNQLINSKDVHDGIKEDNFGKLLLDKIREYGEEGYSYYWTYSHIGFLNIFTFEWHRHTTRSTTTANQLTSANLDQSKSIFFQFLIGYCVPVIYNYYTWCDSQCI